MKFFKLPSGNWVNLDHVTHVDDRNIYLDTVDTHYAVSGDVDGICQSTIGEPLDVTALRDLLESNGKLASRK